ncbi:MAG TPA: 3-dehydroquinate synthase [Solirubrobacter sp.]|nr:3-dehydroquinate synthase [Solirubrobacter sp.]
MADTTLTEHSGGFLVADAVPLATPPQGHVEAVAAREDRYAIDVVTSVDELVARLSPALGEDRVGIVTDETVAALYATRLVGRLRRGGRDVLMYTLPAGERTKDRASADALWDWLARVDFGRRDVLVAFGGGVICDLTGWVASAYMRGLPYVNLPTTLLGMVDGALGGKVAVNHATAKNLLGAFHQPRAVVSDVSVLRSLERRHLSAGLAEAIKKAMIASPDYFTLIEQDVDSILERDQAALFRLVAHASVIKTVLVGRDPYEHDLRRPLNFGHTIGHPLETVTGYGPLLHGEAVAVGMVVACELAVRRGLLDRALLERLVALLRRAQLPTTLAELRAPVEPGAVLAAMGKVRQIRAGSLRWVLPTEVGATLIVDDVEDREVRDALRARHSAS